MGGKATKITDDEVAELCRVYLAVIDAPTTTITRHEDGDGQPLYASRELIGKRVRLVVVEDE